MDAAHDERYSHHEDPKDTKGSDIFAYKLRAGSFVVKSTFSFLVAALAR
jgi:hypothetical protein